MPTATEVGVIKKASGGSFLLEDALPSEIFTPEDFSEEHIHIAKTATEFSLNEVLPAADDIEAKKFEVTKRLLRKAGELGLLAVDVPEAYGGLEMDKVTSALIAESLSKNASFSVSFGAHSGIGTLPLVWYGTEAQKQKYLPKACDRRVDRRVRALGIFLGIGRHEHPHPGCTLLWRSALSTEWRKDVDQQLRFC